MQRKKTKEIVVGGVKIGNFNDITVQSMTNTDTRDVTATIRQIKELEEAGCEIVRVAVPDKAAAEAVRLIKKEISVPLVCDIHFDYRLALIVLDAGIDKLRINPGNIGNADRIREVVVKAKERHVPIRIGVNSGSLETPIYEKYRGVTHEALVESAMKHVRILEELDFFDIVISIKAPSVTMTIDAYKLLSEKVDYPLHVGITEAGGVWAGSIKSAVGIGAILNEGIGDTIRVSLTGNPVEEVRVGREILKALGLRKYGIEIVSCPTCGRTEVDLIHIANEVENKCHDIKKNIKVAVMGCPVNGPGEARDADLGVACAKGIGVIFKKGVIVKKVDEDEIVSSLMNEIKNY